MDETTIDVGLTKEIAPMPAGRRTVPMSNDGGHPDDDMQAVLDMLQSLNPAPIEGLEASEARKQPTPAMAVAKLLEERGLDTNHLAVGSVEDRTIDGPESPINIRIYTPASAAEHAGPLPVVLYIHGGGWVIADLDSYDSSAREVCVAAHCLVVSTHYRQGPESRFPAAHDDTFAAYKWVMANAASLGGDPARIAVVGESVGGNMACAISMRARDAGLPLPVHQVLVYPVANYDFDSPSYREQSTGKPLNRAMMQWFFDKYLTSTADGDDPRISLVRRANLAGLPPTTVIIAELDPLRSEGQELAERLEQAHVPVRGRTFQGVTHEFFGMGRVVAQAREAIAFAGEQLRQSFGI